MEKHRSVQETRFRKDRFKELINILEQIDVKGRRIKVLDFGGKPEYWEKMRDQWMNFNLEIIVVNFETFNMPEGSMYTLFGDACDLKFEDSSFDVVHSSSVIEHVATRSNIRRMAAEVARLTPRYYVQTPNFWFPIELHYRMPLIHFAPEIVRAGLLLRRDLGFFRKAANLDEAMGVVQSVNLLSQGQMKQLFPDATIKHEEFYGFTKSIIAVH